MTQKECCFIIPYFGKLPDNMPIFLESCRYNPNYCWIIFTNDTTEYCYPSNVTVHYCSFEQICSRIQNCFDFPIALSKPQKLCDFKPAYGYIFQDELAGFPFWGYCDLDQIFGNLSKFIPRSILEKYDKIFSLGHMTIYRNTPEINRIFMNQTKDREVNSYRQIFSSSSNFCFDEWPSKNVNINLLAEDAALRINYEWVMCDIVPYRSSFVESCFDAHKKRWCTGESNILIVWKDGSAYEYYLKDGVVCSKEVAYVHIQKRKLSLKQYRTFCNSFWIVPNKIRSFEPSITEEQIICQLKRIRFLSFFRKEEFKREFHLKKELWSHRFAKYILHK